MDTKGIKEVDFEGALKISKSNGSRMIWLGTEPIDYISRLLGIDKKYMSREDPEEIIYSDAKKLKRFDGCIFVCYHGNTSGFLSRFLKKQHAIDTYNLRGGVTAVVGEIF